MKTQPVPHTHTHKHRHHLGKEVTGVKNLQFQGEVEQVPGREIHWALLTMQKPRLIQEIPEIKIVEGYEITRGKYHIISPYSSALL